MPKYKKPRPDPTKPSDAMLEIMRLYVKYSIPAIAAFLGKSRSACDKLLRDGCQRAGIQPDRQLLVPYLQEVRREEEYQLEKKNREAQQRMVEQLRQPDTQRRFMRRY